MHEYINSFWRCNEKNLPPKDKFYKTLSGDSVTDEEYKFALDVYKKYNCRIVADYHNLYLKTDIELLADGFRISGVYAYNTTV